MSGKRVAAMVIFWLSLRRRSLQLWLAMWEMERRGLFPNYPEPLGLRLLRWSVRTMTKDDISYMMREEMKRIARKRGRAAV